MTGWIRVCVWLQHNNNYNIIKTATTRSNSSGSTNTNTGSNTTIFSLLQRTEKNGQPNRQHMEKDMISFFVMPQFDSKDVEEN